MDNAIRPVFDHFDRNKDGVLSRDELRFGLHMIGIEIADAEEIVSMVAAADSNSDGFLDFPEFASFYHGLHAAAAAASSHTIHHDAADSGPCTETSTFMPESTDHVQFSHEIRGENEPCAEDEDVDQDLRDAFQLFDKNGDGFISAEELQIVLTSIGLTQGRLLSDCRNMIRSVDADGDGLVSFPEFKHMMLLPAATPSKST